MRIKLTMRLSDNIEDGSQANLTTKIINTTKLNPKEIEDRFLVHMKGFAQAIARHVDGFNIRAVDPNIFFEKEVVAPPAPKKKKKDDK